jgi:hypothetical protein
MTHETINTILITAIGVGIYLQDRKVSLMKTIMDAYDPDKLKKAHDIILESKEHEYKLKMSLKTKEIVLETQKSWENVNKDFQERYGELLTVAFNGLLELTPDKREEVYKSLPKNAQGLKDLFRHYEKGDIPNYQNTKTDTSK